MASPGSSNTGQSSILPKVGAFLFARQFLDLAENQTLIRTLRENPEMILPFKFEDPIDQLTGITLRLQELDLVNTKKKRIKFRSSPPNKTAKYATSIAKTPTPNHGACYNCNSRGHYVIECPEPLFCRYCKGTGHYISICPLLQSRRKGKLNALPTSSSLSS